MEILRTKRDIEKDARDNIILKEYADLLVSNPGAKPWRIMRTIGANHDLSPEWVRHILVKKGAYINANSVPKC